MKKKKLSFGAWVAVIGLVVTVLAGTYWTASAIIDGNMVSALTRIAVAGLVGSYYVLLFQGYAIRGSRFG